MDAKATSLAVEEDLDLAMDLHSLSGCARPNDPAKQSDKFAAPKASVKASAKARSRIWSAGSSVVGRLD